MLRRNLGSTWVAGAYLCPGGAVDTEDRGPEAAQRCPGRNDAAASALLGVAMGGLGFWVAAVRETFEEAGVLLARPRRGGTLDLSRLRAARDAINRGSLTFWAFLPEDALVLDVDRLHVFSHLLTPHGSPPPRDPWSFVAHPPERHAHRPRRLPTRTTRTDGAGHIVSRAA